MPVNSSWDWILLYYVGTVIMKMTPRHFWYCTPRKLHLLVKMHAELNDSSKSEKEETKYIDQVL